MVNKPGVLAEIRAAGLTVAQQLTPYNFSDANNEGRIKYLVIHYVGATGGAAGNADFYGAAYRGASAHYFVGFAGEIVQVVEDGDVAWHCGRSDGKYKHPTCRNSNSVGIEMCVRNPNGSVNRTDAAAGWYFEPATIEATQRLVRVLMARYGIPLENVIRHYDVTGKMCPAPYCNGQLDWAGFKAGLAQKEETIMNQKDFDALQAASAAAVREKPVSSWAADAWEKAKAKGVFDGTAPQGSFTREQAAVVLDRLGLLK